MQSDKWSHFLRSFKFYKVLKSGSMDSNEKFCNLRGISCLVILKTATNNCLKTQQNCIGLIEKIQIQNLIIYYNILSFQSALSCYFYCIHFIIFVSICCINLNVDFICRKGNSLKSKILEESIQHYSIFKTCKRYTD